MYILSAQRHIDVKKAFEEYRAYLAKNKSRFPRLAYSLATSDWYFNFRDHKCPHDSWLEKILIYEPSEGSRNESRKTEITILLLGAFHDGNIELTYKNVKSYRINALNTENGHGSWRYDEFRISDNGSVLHEIEWAGYQESSSWLIEAEDIEFKWCG